ncbi:MAG: sigma 54 modulation/S30EA ribosomal C-terminal domain-containing protein, partial [Candidatus Aminicenantales bacterium]
AFDHLERRIKKEREKLRERKRRRVREKEIFPSSEASEARKRIVRSEDYSPKPLSLEEALLQFDLDKKKEVFVFRKLDSEKWAVLYRRKDGHYGLIEPE